MRSLIVLILLAAVASAACAPQTAGPVPSAIVSKDSLAFEIPLPEGVAIDAWDIRISRYDRLGEKSFGTARITVGPESETGDRHIICTWTRDRESAPPIQVSARTTFSVDNDVIRFTFKGPEMVERVTRIRPMHAALRGVGVDGAPYERRLTVTYLRDPREAQARKISGPFSADEYAIYQIVIDRACLRLGSEQKVPFVVVTPTTDLRVFTAPQLDLYFEILGVDEDTAADVVSRRSTEADLSSLTQLGYEVTTLEAYMQWHKSGWNGRGEPYRRAVYVSAIGFNHSRTQAIIYVNNSNESDILRLDKVNGQWHETGRYNQGNQ
ncbi:MAG TPA: hypothetical protein VFX92_00715 [Candidatus Krumholzibacteria bacterium]|nr:hypothetical protein [Candidatus Krumholzibacteria bacterium]